jgi:hypothetical protein
VQKKDLEAKVKLKGISLKYIRSVLANYFDFPSFSYMSIYNPTTTESKEDDAYMNRQ